MSEDCLNADDLLQSAYHFLHGSPFVLSAVLFGSSARALANGGKLRAGADLDFHVISAKAVRLSSTDWSAVMPAQRYLFRALKPATGGAQKITVFFEKGSMDLIVIPSIKMQLARFGVHLGLHKKFAFLNVALNEMSTCLRGSYKFIKGEQAWGKFYAFVDTKMEGVRLDNHAILELADCYICDFFWAAKKIRDGELCAGQYCLHRNLSEMNFKIMRERLQRTNRLPETFGLGRKLESVLSPDELAFVSVNAQLHKRQLSEALVRSLIGFKAMMKDLIDGWEPSQSVRSSLDSEIRLLRQNL
jgi:hypothetical protein